VADRLSEQEIDAALVALSGWRHEGAANAVAKSYRFADFSEAFAFMTRVALVAEKADHHPDWSNSWNKVDIVLTTHSAGGVTGRDITLAEQIDALAR
jgi:4a-hydroxytetrahydrobiopterin dehydratase